MNFQNKKLLIVPQLPTDMNLKDVMEVGCKMVLNMQSRTKLPSTQNINTLLKMEHAKPNKPKQDMELANGLK